MKPLSPVHFALLLGLWATVSAAAAPAFDFKGIRLGESSTPKQIRERLGVSCGIGAEDIQVCNGRVTIAEEPAEMNLVLSATGVVQRINLTLEPEQFDIVATELIRKFGKPATHSRSTVQNGFGANFAQQAIQWNGPAGTVLFFEKYAGSLRQSMLFFSTAADRRKMESLKKDRHKDL